MELTTQDVIEVEKHLKEHRGIIYVFAPSDVGDWDNYKHSRQDYLDWLHKQYTNSVCKYTNTMLSDSLHSKVSAYLQVKWEMRNTSLGIIRHDLIRLRNEIGPLQNIKQTLVCLRKAQLNVQTEMNKLRI